jgi:hypothetical protein
MSVALVTEHPPDLMLAVGDWFLAESSAGRPVRGVIQTVFIAHGPTVSSKILEFDEKLESLVAGQGSPEGRSKHWPVSRMKEILQTLPHSSYLTGAR